MSVFLQVHALFALPASNPNRDRNNEPKKIVIGNVERQRISSQSLKRSWRTSDIFLKEFGPALGEGALALRTKELGPTKIYDILAKEGIEGPAADQWTRIIAAVFGKTKPENKKDNRDHLRNETMVFLSPREIQNLTAFIKKVVKDKLQAPNVKGDDVEKEAAKIRPQIMVKDEVGAVDLALFGRMFANDKDYSVEAAAQVMHAIGVTEFLPENDFWSTVDDLKQKGETDDDRGGGHLGDSTIGSSIYYVYASLNLTQLEESLKDKALVARAAKAFVKAACTVLPCAKGNSHAHASRAFWARAERGQEAPRNLSLAFLDPINDRKNVAGATVAAIRKCAEDFNAAYGQMYEACAELNVHENKGKLEDLLKLAGE